MILSNHLSLCCPLLLLLSAFFHIRIFSNELALHIRWPKYWSFSFSISPPNECSGLISFRMDWFDLLAVQGTLKSFPQHHNSKGSILWCSTFFMIQLSHRYMTTANTIVLTPWTFSLIGDKGYLPLQSVTDRRVFAVKDPYIFLLSFRNKKLLSGK